MTTSAIQRLRHAGPRGLQLAAGWLGGLALGITLSSGCAALTNPTADGLPVRRVPPEFLEAPKNDQQTIPLTLLEQKRPAAYELASGDVLAVYIEGILGEKNQPVPSLVPSFPTARDQHPPQPTVGYPVPVREDGTIVLPWVEPIAVQGLTVSAVRDAVIDVYTRKQFLKPAEQRVFVSLYQPRHYEVVVMRQESASFVPGPDGVVNAAKLGTGHVVNLPAYENDVLHALALTGGLPGLDAYNEVIVEHRCFRDEAERGLVLQKLAAAKPNCAPPVLASAESAVVRIPLRAPHGESFPVQPADVVLQSGDVVFLEARDREIFFTGGLLPAGEHPLPRDHDLDVIEAVARVRGPLVNGAFSTNNLAGNLIATGVGGPSPSLLTVVRRVPGGQVPIRVDLNRALRDPRERILVRAGDVLILQEKPGEALARYFYQTFFNFNLIWLPIHERFATGVVDVSTPDRLPGRLGVQTITPP